MSDNGSSRENPYEVTASENPQDNPYNTPKGSSKGGSILFGPATVVAIFFLPEGINQLSYAIGLKSNPMQTQFNSCLNFGICFVGGMLAIGSCWFAATDWQDRRTTALVCLFAAMLLAIVLVVVI